jgi:hypothetical protein
MAVIEEVLGQLGQISNLQVERGALLARYTRFGIGGPADIYAETASADTFIEALACARASGLSWAAIGSGTNLIVADEGFRGIVLRFTAVRVSSEGCLVEAEAGAELQAVVFLNVLNAAITCVFSGIGRPELHRRAVAASAVVMMIVIYPACKLLGVVGGQVAALLAIIVSYLLQVIRMRGLTGLELLRYGKAFVPAVLVSGGLLGVGLGARFLGLATRPIANIALSAGSCVIAYALCVPAFLRIKQTA